MKLAVFLLTWIPILGVADVFTSLEKMKLLVGEQTFVLDSLRYYVTSIEGNLGNIKLYVSRLQTETAKAGNDITKYVGNPINAFILTKRWTVDLIRLEELLNQNLHLTSSVGGGASLGLQLDDRDLTEAASALLRLQEYYELDTRKLTQGILGKTRASNPMTASDCYEMGSEMLRQGEYLYALAWTREAYRKASGEPRDIELRNIMKKLAKIHRRLNDTQGAIDWRNRIKQNTSTIKNHILFTESLETSRQSNNVSTSAFTPKIRGMKLPRNYNWKLYRGLCSGQYRLPHNITQRLKCRYETSHHPFLKLAPIKVEEKYLDPDVLMFHDIVRSREIEAMLHLGIPMLRRSMVVKDENTNASVIMLDNRRVSRSGWVDDQESPVVARLSRRISDMTGLDTSKHSAETFQVGSYVVGGHYEPHTDPIKFNVLKNRLATVLIYLNDVEEGGGTAFVELGVAVQPRRGSALVWRNLHASGQLDRQTLHGACPVLRGHKYIATKWITVLQQEFRAPCTLEYQHETYMRTIPAPVLITK